jgi:hypothetical protein
MTALLIRQALESRLAAMTPSLATAFENVPFKPTNGTAYQSVHVMFTAPDNREIGRQYVARGFMQVSLFYPEGGGAEPATSRAELIRSTFYRGLSLTNGAVTVTIDRTPEILPGSNDDDRFVLPVRIPFYAPVNP